MNDSTTTDFVVWFAGAGVLVLKVLWILTQKLNIVLESKTECTGRRNR